MKPAAHQTDPIAPANAAGFAPVRDDVFERIAGRYDLLSDLFSFGLHRLWKRRVAKLIAGTSWVDMLDAAAGTGDIALRVSRLLADRDVRRMTVSDLSAAMLSRAESRAKALGMTADFVLLDAESMPTVPDESVDLYSMSLGLKICDRHHALREAFRVLRPGGHIVTLEASTIPLGWMQACYLAYMRMCMPLIGWLATDGDASAYIYLLNGIRGFPSAEALSIELKAIGFERVEFERLSFGIVAIHRAIKPIA